MQRKMLRFVPVLFALLFAGQAMAIDLVVSAAASVVGPVLRSKKLRKISEASVSALVSASTSAARPAAMSRSRPVSAATALTRNLPEED